MNETPLKDFSKTQSPKTSLLLMLLALGKYEKVGDLGIAGILIFRSKKGKYLYIRRW